MKYQVSTRLCFDKKADRDSVSSSLETKRDAGLQLPGDYLTTGISEEGLHYVEARMRFDNQKDRDDVYDALDTESAKTSQNMSGHIEKHTCEHDDGKGCTGQTKKVW